MEPGTRAGISLRSGQSNQSNAPGHSKQGDTHTHTDMDFLVCGLGPPVCVYDKHLTKRVPATNHSRDQPLDPRLGL